jgi:hypothetical protein
MKASHFRLDRASPWACSIIGSSIDCSDPDPVTSAATITWWREVCGECNAPKTAQPFLAMTACRSMAGFCTASTSAMTGGQQAGDAGR